MYTFLVNPEKILKQFKDLVEYLPEQYKKEISDSDSDKNSDSDSDENSDSDSDSDENSD
jgi:hypothetical protein